MTVAPQAKQTRGSTGRICWEKLEAPPGFEPGMEVLQTSALPLGDGAPQRRLRGRDEHRIVPADARLIKQTEENSERSNYGRKPAAERSRRRRAASVGKVRRPTRAKLNLERETGFEPATSTLARSHSTTELFPPERSTYHTAGVRFKIRARPTKVRLKPDATYCHATG